jgi:hypothetical protein
MAIILILRCVRRDREAEFLKVYNQERPDHADFISESLTKIDNSTSLPEPMRSLELTNIDCIPYLNVAFWKSALSFYEHFKDKINVKFNPDIEVCDRLRLVLDEVQFGEIDSA